MRKPDLNIDRLAIAVQRSRLVLQKWREERREMVRQYVGSHWSTEGTSEKVPVNLISLYVSIMVRSLVAKNPRVMLSTFQRPNKAAVAGMQDWANKRIPEMRLANTLQRCVMDALFSMGICKVALSSPADSAKVAWSLKSGQPFAERVDLDDLVFDTHARDFNEVSYIGHRFRVPIDAVKDSKIYNKSRLQLQPSQDKLFNTQGDQRISVLGRGMFAGSVDEYEDYVDLWEIYLPRQRAVVTLADGNGIGPDVSIDPLREQNWIGPDGGPYIILGYQGVPGNAMPKAPIQDLIDLHDAANRSYRKVIRSVDRTKEITMVSGGSMEDGSRVMNANDGEIIKVDQPDNIKVVAMGGTTTQHVLAVATMLKDLFDFMGGNLALLGGRSPQSKTAAQDKMLNDNAAASVADLQEKTITFASDVLRSLCWYWWNDPINTIHSPYAPQATPEFAVTRRITPQMRSRSRFEELEVSVDPYSIQPSTPQVRMAQINQVVQQVIMPMMPLLQQQGVAFDVNAYLKKIATYMDMPDLAEIITMQDPPSPHGAEEGSGSQGGDMRNERPRMPVATERTYNRVSMPGRTQRGDDMNRVNQLLGVNPGGSHEKNGKLQ